MKEYPSRNSHHQSPSQSQHIMDQQQQQDHESGYKGPSSKSTLVCNNNNMMKIVESEAMVVAEGNSSGREKLKRHRVSVAGRVWIPEIWGQEDLLKDWIDCSAFDAPLVPSRIMMARKALVQEGRRSRTRTDLEFSFT